MNPHLTEVMAEARLYEGARGCIQRLAWLCSTSYTIGGALLMADELIAARRNTLLTTAVVVASRSVRFVPVYSLPDSSCCRL